jgi:hypothetical protein
LLLACLSAVLGLPATGCQETDDRPAEWSYLSVAVFQPNCATSSCHSPAAAAAGLDFSDPDRGYTSLTGLWVWIVDPAGTEEAGCRKVEGQVVCQRNHRPLVVAFNPAQSRLVNMLRARGAARMPPDRPLPEVDIELVERWILGGARKTHGGPPAGTEAAVHATTVDGGGTANARGDGGGAEASAAGGGSAGDSRADGGSS